MSSFIPVSAALAVALDNEKVKQCELRIVVSIILYQAECAIIKSTKAYAKLAQEQPHHVPSNLPTVHSISSVELIRKMLPSQENAFFVADLGEVIQQWGLWKKYLPRVQPFYGTFIYNIAVKCNPDKVIIKTLFECGSNFDCASKNEIELALEAGADASQIIFANPCKQASHIRFAASKGVNLMTFDNIDELVKIKQVMPLNARLVLRILADDSKSICRFGVKFGASLDIVPGLFKAAAHLGLNVVGVSFHVGSGCFDAMSYRDAVKLAREAFDIGESLGFTMEILDLGGGFSGQRNSSGLDFKSVAAALSCAIDEYIPAHIKVISEPGRYFVSDCYALCTSVIGRRKFEKEGRPAFMYYLNDGIYGSFNCIPFDHAKVSAEPLARKGVLLLGKDTAEDLPKFASSLWGPTCDSIDCIDADLQFPEMQIGDWIMFRNMGAYTNAAASEFNGFGKSVVSYTHCKTE